MAGHSADARPVNHLARARKVFAVRNIDDLIVVNAKHQPVGLVDSQDLPKLKLM
jgi:hypothetical protein